MRASTFNDGLSFNSPARRTQADLQWLVAASWQRRQAMPQQKPARVARAMSEPLECRRLLAAGDLDPTFSEDGVAPFTFVPQFDHSTSHDIITLPDGKLLAVGTTDPQDDGNTAMITLRYNANGTLDGSFGAGGVVVTKIAGSSASGAHAAAVAPGGKVIVAGFATLGTDQEVAVVRYNADGSLDTSFSDDGMKTTGYGDRDDLAHDVAVDAAGKIILAGGSTGSVGAGSDILVARLNVNGTNDTSFSGDGLTRVGFGAAEAARGVALLSDGRIATAGGTSAGGGDFAFAVLTGSGALDTTFSGDGKLTVDFAGGNDAANDMIVDPAGRLVAVGSTTSGDVTQVALVRLNPNGTLDTTFDGDGQVSVNAAGGVGRDVLVDSANLVVGATSGVIRFNAADGALIGGLPRLGRNTLRGITHLGPNALVSVADDPEGRFSFKLSRSDPEFGNDGQFDPHLNEGERAIRMALQPDGKAILLAASRFQLLLARYHADGSVDTSFGFNGRAVADFSAIDPIGVHTFNPHQIQLLPDGRILVGGSLRQNEAMGFAFAQFNPDGTPDTTFGGGDGIALGPTGSDDTGLRVLTLLPGGGFLAGGTEGLQRFFISKHNADGSLDTVLRTSFDFARDASVNLLLPAPGGKVLFGGWYEQASEPAYALVRLNASGSLDTTFSGDGVLRDFLLDGPGDEIPGDFRPLAEAATLDDGRIVGVYATEWFAGQPLSAIDFGVTRLTADGTVDTTFGGDDGIVTADFGFTDRPDHVLIDPAGRIIVGGVLSPENVAENKQRTLGIARFTPDGVLDTSFGGGDGKVTRPLGGTDGGQLLDLAPATPDTFYAYTRDFSVNRGAPTHFEVLRFQNPAQTPFHGSPFVIGSTPVTIQAEHFDHGGQNVAYVDNSPGNGGGTTFRADEDVDLKPIADGGHRVLGTYVGEWVEYTIDVDAAGTFALASRVSSKGSGGSFHVELREADTGDFVSNLTGAITIPNTGEHENWVTLTHDVTLPAGTHVLRLVIDTNSTYGSAGNFDWFQFTAGSEPDPVDPQQPFHGSPFVVGATPVTIEAEQFDVGGQNVAYFDNSPGNGGGTTFRADEDVDLKPIADGGWRVLGTYVGEWVEYTIDVDAAGTFALASRVSSKGSGGSFHLELRDPATGAFVSNLTGAITIPNTGEHENWVTLTQDVNLPAGTYVLRLAIDTNSSYGSAGNFDWMTLTQQQTDPDPVDSQQPFHGAPFAVGATPVTIEAEHFDHGGQNVAYFDNSPGNGGGTTFRADEDVDLKGIASGGFRVLGTYVGEWIEYTIDIDTAGTFALASRVSSKGSGGSFHLELRDPATGEFVSNLTGSITIPNTGAHENWTTLTHDVNLPAGTYVLRLAIDTNSTYGSAGNFDWFQFTASSEPDPVDPQQPFHGAPFAVGATPVTIEAEHFDLGGQNVAYFDNSPGNGGGTTFRFDEDVDLKGITGGGFRVLGTYDDEWIEYTIDVAAAGTYTLASRVSSRGSGGSFHVERRDPATGAFVSNLTGTITIPNTGAHENWVMLTHDVTLPAGTHVLRLAIDTNSTYGSAGNFDWFAVTQVDPLAQQLDAAVAFAQEQLRDTVDGLADNSYPQYTQSDGSWKFENVEHWTAGFLPGALWQMYDRTGDTFWRDEATARTLPLAAQTSQIDDLTFRILNTFRPLYEVSGSDSHRQVLLDAAASKNTQWNETVGAFRTSWRRSDSGDPRANFGVLLDQSMDMELMFWAAKETGNQQYYDRAVRHLQTVAQHVVRSDGGSYHWVYFYDQTGEFVSGETYQGYSDESTWARGQAWAIYSFTMAYRETGQAEFLTAARKVADYFLARLPSDHVPFWDFDDPAAPNALRDSSAAAITASGLLELSQLLRSTGAATAADVYLTDAKEILGSLASDAYLADGTPHRGVLLHGALNVPTNTGTDSSLIFGDYYFLEALNRYAAATVR